MESVDKKGTLPLFYCAHIANAKDVVFIQNSAMATRHKITTNLVSHQEPTIGNPVAAPSTVLVRACPGSRAQHDVTPLRSEKHIRETVAEGHDRHAGVD
jgi:hypothetical protein